MEYLFWFATFLLLGVFGAIGVSALIGSGVASVAGEQAGTGANLLAGVLTLGACWAIAFHCLRRAFEV